MLKEAASNELTGNDDSKLHKSKRLQNQLLTRIESAINQGITFHSIHPQDYMRIPHRPYLLDLYSRSPLLHGYYDMKIREKYERYHVPKVKVLTGVVERAKRKYPLFGKPDELNSADELNTRKEVYAEIDRMDEDREGDHRLVRVGSPNKSVSMNGIKFHRIYSDKGEPKTIVDRYHPI